MSIPYILPQEFQVRILNLKFLFSFFVISLIFSTIIFSQKASDSDSEAKKILDKLRKEYDSNASMEVHFDMILNLPNQAEEKQKGKVIQAGTKYFVDLDDQAIYCNGEMVWLHLKDNHEVQINDMDSDDENFLTPKEWMTAYEKEDFYYAIVNKNKSNGNHFVEIEFKPLSPRSEYNKMRVRVNTTKNNLDKMDVFSKDGSKYSIIVQNITYNKPYNNSTFSFDPSKFPGIHIEDLRL